MNATSAYDLLYNGLSEDDRKQMEEDFSGIMKKAVSSQLEQFQTAIGKAVENMANQVGFWKDWVEENNRPYEFLKTIQEGIWNSMLKTNPLQVGEWDMRKLVAAWREAFPEEFSKIVNSETARELAQVKESLEFERQCNRKY